MIRTNAEAYLQKIQREESIPLWLHGLTEEAKGYGIFLLWKQVNAPLLYILPERKKAEEIFQDLKTFVPDDNLYHLPLKEKSPGGNIYQILYRIKKEENLIIVGSVESILQQVPDSRSIESDTLDIRKGAQIPRDDLVNWLVKKGYQSVPLVEEQGDFSVRGSIVDFYSPLYNLPVRVEFFADTIESVRNFDPVTQRSVERLQRSVLSSKDEVHLANTNRSNLCSFIELLPDSYQIILDEPADLEDKIETLNEHQIKEILARKTRFYISTLAQSRSWMRVEEELPFHSSPLPSYRGDLELLSQDIRDWQRKEYRVCIVTPTSGQAKRIQDILEKKGFPFQIANFVSPSDSPSLQIIPGDIRRGFILSETRDVMVTDQDIFRRYRERRKRLAPSDEEKKIRGWRELKEGDYVVHVDYGIGKFKGLVTLGVGEKKKDYFQIDYKGSDRLYVPFSQFDRLHKYVGDSDNPPPVYNLEGNRWEFTKRKAREATRELASSLLNLHSIRKVKSGHSFSSDNEWQLEFEASFPYQETSDQLVATQQVKQDMENPTPMDRLVCGDSGYGKTEVAIRASFKAVIDGKQVVVLVPTTILAEQHYRTFSERIADYPIRVEMLSRFQSRKKQTEIIQDLRRGSVDIIIGTHRLFQKDIEFKDLGLIIIDEEQKFGVLQKKKLKDLKKTVDVLTLSATPIPRSLYMALTGVYELSTIFSPPQDRQNVETEVTRYDIKTIKNAIIKELNRGGQVFYLYNRVKDIQKVAEKLRKALPQVRFAVAHGQMRSARLESTVRDFLEGKYDVLVCTSIIESGIDMPNVNTLIVENSEQFGLADLYQLRGRVGRGREKGYTYFLFDPKKSLNDQAKKRLQIINQFKGAGTGFKIAMEDLQIRGAGNLLGKEQHGHIAAVGFTLYSQLLNEEVKKLKGEEIKPAAPLHIYLDVEARLPSDYVPSETQRMQLYQKVGKIEKEQGVLEFKEELRDRFGVLPPAARNLVHLLYIKFIVKDIGVSSIRKTPNGILVTFSPFYPLTQDKKQSLQKHLSEVVRTFPMDKRKLFIPQSGEKQGEELLIWLSAILQKVKDLLI